MDQSPQRQPRVLWASTSCLLDISGGALRSIRQILKELASNSHEAAILGATIFTVPEASKAIKNAYNQCISNNESSLILEDEPLIHHLLITRSLKIGDFCSDEQVEWFTLYIEALEDFRPDIVFFDGGFPFDYLIPTEARIRGIPTASYVTHTTFTGTRWCGDVDIIITDSHATARLYEKRSGLRPIPVGKFIDPNGVIAETNSRKRITFVNPSLHKGVTITAMLAVLLERRRPDIVFEIVGSVENWRTTVASITASLGSERRSLSNAIETPFTDDMRAVYAHSRILLAPSLGYESSGRVLAEAMLNGIPTLSTDSGGMLEMIGDGGIVLDLPDRLMERPYNNVPTPRELASTIAHIERLYDDDTFYADLSRKAYEVGRTRHSIAASTQRLIDAFRPLIAARAGDGDFAEIGKAWHKHGVAPVDNFFEPAPGTSVSEDPPTDDNTPP